MGAHRPVAGCLVILAAFAAHALAGARAVLARAATLQLASRAAPTGAHRAVAGCLVVLAAFAAHALAGARAVLARAATLLLASRAAPTGAHRPVAGYLVLLAAFAAHAVGATLQLASHAAPTGAHRAVAGCLVVLAAFATHVLAGARAVLARAATLQLASRAAPTGAHRAVAGCLLLLAVFAVHARGVAGIDYTPYADEQNMHAVATALGADRSLGWTNNTSPCIDHWTGVTCNRRGRVSAIYARRASLNGTLAQEIGLLPDLLELDLRDNSITGDVPDVLFIYIQSLRLDGNKLTSVPGSFLYRARDLRVFSIGNNSMLRSWELLHDSSRLETLRVYIADNAHLSGTISAFLAGNDFPALKVFSVPNNYLDGEIPARFASPRLRHLDLSNNRLSGPVDFLANLTGLRVLRLSLNSFTGPLPDFSAHWDLQVVDLSYNCLTGVVPASLVGLPMLDTVSIKNNLFQGAIPVFGSSVHNDIPEAALGGSFCRADPGPCSRQVETFIAIAAAFRFPVAFASSWKGDDPCNGWLGVFCDKNGVIDGLNFCRLGLNGTIHPAFGDLKGLVMLNLAGNNLTGEVPQSITTLPFLRILDISDNSLEGTMPRLRSSVTVWAGGNKNLTVAGASRLCISDALVAAVAMAIVVLVVA